MSTREELTAQSSEKSASKLPDFDLVMGNDWVFWPFRSFSKLMARSRNDLAAVMEINRRVADEMRELVRQEQDIVMELSEKMLHRMVPDGGSAETLRPGADIEAIYDSAVQGMRELGKAVADAQIRSIEALHKGVQRSEESAAPDKTADAA